MMRFDFHRQIAVTGLQRSGKTVFLTSLINHLKEHAPERFRLGNGTVQIAGFQDQPVDADEFEYDIHRARLSESLKWPVKSKLTSQYRCRFLRSDWGWSIYQLTLVDIPGERFADIAMAVHDYDQWSEQILKLFVAYTEYREQAKPYLDLVEKEGVTEDEVLAAYRLTLSRFIAHYLPIVTPSSFLLDPAGQYASSRDPEWLVANRYCGLDKARQFAPLPRKVREQRPDLATPFRCRFEEYKGTVVLPIGGLLASSHAMAVLVDVTTLLAGGLGMFLGNRALLEHLIRYVDPGFGLFGQLGLTMAPLLRITIPGISRLAFVASKVDKVHEADRNKVLALLKEMNRQIVAGHQAEKNLQVEYFNCAAVRSTASHPGGKLEGRFASEKGTERLFQPSVVPESWPDDWEPGSFRFPDVLPDMPKGRHVPPQHLGLDSVANFLLAD